MNKVPASLPDQQMKLFSNRRAVRRTTWSVLLVWLFVLVSGVANACLLEGRSVHGDHGASPDAASRAHPRNDVEAARSHVHDSGDRQSSKTSCAKVCDDGSSSPIKQERRQDPADPPQLALSAPDIREQTAEPVAFRRLEYAPYAAPAGVPVSILFSRLTL